ncbi:6-phosphogluconolactonase [Rubrobacter taiwanensis]|uniref:6-phosphogluconolactonase n=1 Tax=Rubrobacter taiwanensis TaxID=185139 RepID=A0A4R1BS86_9ACTN|nr:6-phosphogluconolactonase [Rubrobacter taiwanensis]TCJ20085.1 6-phosphogluconolactonase [Rubrobacter taiwanensis]
MNLRVCENPEELARTAAEEFAAQAERAVGERGRFAAALAGGSTPRAAYELLAREYKDRSFWERTHIFFGDERAVPPEHEESNYRMAREALLECVPVGRVYRMRGELPPEEAAAAYEAELREFFGEGVPRLDLILLGIGADGHTASLFPETSALEVHDRFVVANPVLKLGATRLTLTLPVLNAARAVIFLVSGEEKAAALREILRGGEDPRKYPAKLVRPAGGELLWLADRAAAGELKE